MAYLAGISGKAVSGTTDLNIKEWSCNDTNNVQDATHSGSSGKFIPIKGILKATAKVTAVVDGAALFTGTPNIKAGENIDLTLKLGTSSSNYVITAGVIESVESQSVVDGLVTYTFNVVGAISSYPT